MEEHLTKQITSFFPPPKRVSVQLDENGRKFCVNPTFCLYKYLFASIRTHSARNSDARIRTTRPNSIRRLSQHAQRSGAPVLRGPFGLFRHLFLVRRDPRRVRRACGQIKSGTLRGLSRTSYASASNIANAPVNYYYSIFNTAVLINPFFVAVTFY